MGKEKNKRIEKLKLATIGILYLSICFAAGLLGGRLMYTKNINMSGGFLIMTLFIFIMSFIVQIILHEVGHLIAGILSGYEFISFRVGTLTIIKEDGKFAIKKYKIKGTAGQCLMMPKGENYNEIPYILFNLGGVLINGLVSILCFFIYSFYSSNEILNVVLLSTCFSGILSLITNGIPMEIGGIANDGYNVISIRKSKAIQYYFYIQLKVNGLIYKGVRIKDMPATWFMLEEKSDFNNPLITSVKCFEANYYHDRKEFNKAKDCYKELLNNAPNIIKIYEYEIKCELLFYEIMGEKREDKIKELYTEELKKYIKATDCYITRKRLMYAYFSIIEKDIEKSNKILTEIEICKKTYPAKAEVESELEIIEIIKNKIT